MLKSFRELEVWQKAHSLVLEVYRLTEKFPDRERYGIVSQLRRSAVSVPANTAEGFGRRSTKEFLQSLTHSNGSLEESRCLLLLSADLKYLDREDFERLDKQCDSIAQMLSALSRSLKNRVQALRESRVASRGSRARVN